MKQFRTLFLLILGLVLLVPLTATAQYYGNVGEYITLPEPTPPSTEYTVTSSTFSTRSAYLDVAPGTSRVLILSYFEGSQTVECYYHCVRQYKVAGKVYEDHQNLTTYYTIYCSSNPNPGQDPNPGNSPTGWTKQGDLYVCTVNTVEGIPMKFAIFNEREKTCCGYGDYYNFSAIDRSTAGAITVPSNVNGYTVVSVGGYAFEECTKLTSIVLPTTATTTGTAAFEGCTSLTSLDFLSSVVWINERAFAKCDGLVSVVVPNSVEYIQQHAFNGCFNLTDITLGTGVKSIGKGAFASCPHLTTITSLQETPPTIQDEPASSSYYKEWILYVPSESAKAKYAAAAYWKDFKEIRVMGEESKYISIDATNFPDANFRDYLLEQDYGSDGILSERDIKGITELRINSKSISNLKGIEHFTELKYLSCAYNQLTSLDVSKNIALSEFYCSNNKLTSLDVSKNTALTYLGCSNNQLTSLDVSKNTALTYLDLGYNQLTSLDISKNIGLTLLTCSSNKLSSLDVSKNTALTTLSCSFNQLASLDVSKNTALTYLSCYINQLTSLNLSKNVALEQLDCTNNQLPSLDVSKNTALRKFDCYNNVIKGEGMDNLINSLPQNTTNDKHSLKIYSPSSTEENVCTTNHVAKAKAKGWSVENASGEEYGGVDPSAIFLPTIESIDENTPIYDLSGQRVNNLQGKKGIYIINGKKVLVR